MHMTTSHISRKSEANSLSAHETHANMFILHNGVAIVWTSGASTQALLISLYPNDVFVAKKNLPSQEPFTKYPSPPNQTARIRRCCGTCASCMHGYTKERKCVARTTYITRVGERQLLKVEKKDKENRTRGNSHNMHRGRKGRCGLKPA